MHATWHRNPACSSSHCSHASHGRDGRPQRPTGPMGNPNTKARNPKQTPSPKPPMAETGQAGHFARLPEQLASGSCASCFEIVSDFEIRASDFPQGPSSLGQRIRITDSTGTKWTMWDGLDILLYLWVPGTHKYS